MDQEYSFSVDVCQEKLTAPWSSFGAAIFSRSSQLAGNIERELRSPVYMRHRSRHSKSLLTKDPTMSFGTTCLWNIEPPASGLSIQLSRHRRSLDNFQRLLNIIRRLMTQRRASRLARSVTTTRQRHHAQKTIACRWDILRTPVLTDSGWLVFHLPELKTRLHLLEKQTEDPERITANAAQRLVEHWPRSPSGLSIQLRRHRRSLDNFQRY